MKLRRLPYESQITAELQGPQPLGKESNKHISMGKGNISNQGGHFCRPTESFKQAGMEEENMKDYTLVIYV